MLGPQRGAQSGRLDSFRGKKNTLQANKLYKSTKLKINVQPELPLTLDNHVQSLEVSLSLGR